MGKKRHATTDRELRQINFFCPDCRHRFVAELDRARVEDAPELEHHPFRYFAECPRCGGEVPQAAWERNLMAAAAHQTGPRTAEGKAAVAANLAGHPTEAEARLTRFNAMKHGLFARTATYYPAKPGKYPHCEGCEYRDNVCWEQTACLKRTELFLRHHIAFDQQDPKLLQGLRADLQANVQAIIDDIIHAIIAEGVQLKTPAWFYDKEGRFHLAEYRDTEDERRLIYEINAHPLLKVLTEMLARNNMALGDLGMTPKVQDETEQLRGFLGDQAAERENEATYRQQALQNQQKLLALLKDSYEIQPAPRQDAIDAEVISRDE